METAVFKRSISTTEDLNDILNLLTNEEQCLAIHFNHNLICGIYYSHDERIHKFRFNPFLTLTSDELKKVLLHLEFYKPQDDIAVFDIYLLPTRMELLYEIRQSIIESSILSDNVYDLYKKAKALLGKPVTLYDTTDEYIMVGLSATLEDFYYMLYNTRSGNVRFFSAVHKIQEKALDSISQETMKVLAFPLFHKIILDYRHQHFTNDNDEVELISF